MGEIFSNKYFTNNQTIIIEGVKIGKDKKATLLYCFDIYYVLEFIQ